MPTTFLLGNGFDLSLGLKTSYSNFYDYYINSSARYPDYSHIIYQLKNNIEQFREKDWSDLELGLGKYTEKLYNSSDFAITYADIIQNLIYYLKYQQDNFSVNDNQIDYLLEGFRHPNKDLAISELSNYTVSLPISILTFNYTNTIEKIVGHAGDLNNVIHIHGSLDTDDIILGVDNEEQIFNFRYRNIHEVKKYLIKKIANIDNKKFYDQNALSTINNSTLLCIYGASLGESDLTWSNAIKDWLMRDASHKIIYFYHDNSYFGYGSKYDKDVVGVTAKGKLLNNILNCDYNQYENQVRVVVNSDIFRLIY